MDRWPRILVMTVAVLCLIFSTLAILGGNMTSAPSDGVGKIEKGENLNDVHCIMKNTKGEIYTLGYTCVQKFDKHGNFMGGAYYDSNSMKEVTGNEFLSLNDGRVVLLNRGDNIIYIYNENFDIIDEVEVSQTYDGNDFYLDYPNTDASGENVRLSFWGNTVSTENTKTELDAPRNRLFSRDVGLLILIAALAAIFACKFSSKEEAA